jgi:hypothetical protein
MENCNESELLDLWVKNQVDNSIVDMVFVKGDTVLGSSGGIITCKYNATTDDYLDLSETYLDVTVALTSQSKKTDLDAGNYNCGPVNNLFHSLFSSVDIDIQSTPVEKCTNYHYQAYMSQILNRCSGSKDSELQAQLFYKDTATKFESVPTYNSSTQAYGDNEGMKNRLDVFRNSKNVVQLRGRLICDIFNMNKLFINNLNFTMRLTQTASNFRLMRANASDFELSITAADIYFKKIRPSKYVIESNAAKILKQNVVYPITRTKTEMHAIPTGVSTADIKITIGGQIPNRVIVGMVLNSAYTGLDNKNPFNFDNYKISGMTMTVASENRPYMVPLSFNATANHWLNGYCTLFQGMDSNVELTGNNITRLEYPNGNFFVVFNIFKKCNSTYDTILRTGSVNLNLTFSEPTPNPAISLIALSEYDTSFEITNQKQINTKLM